MPKPSATELSPRAVPEVVRRSSKPEPDAEPAAINRRSTPKPDSVPEVVIQKPVLARPSLPAPPNAERVRPSSEIAPAVTSPKPTLEGNTYIDPTDYRLGATRNQVTPSSVVLSERSTGCQRVLNNNQGLDRGACGIPSRSFDTANQQSLPTAYRLGQVPVAGIQPVNVGLVRVSSRGVGFNNNDATPGTYQGHGQRDLAFYNRSVSPLVRPNGNTSYIFPLSIPAVITSAFGWRVHPITGASSFHAGTDIGAPMGTPVLAAYTGQVAIADWMGGYGLAVVLQHSPTIETLYGHMSEIFVQPGQVVEQGTVIGLVGSTGNSTGPHLHFETRELTADGWVATDSGAQVEYALGELIRALQTAQSEPQPRS